MKTPAATKVTTSAPNSANSIAGDNLTPREARVIDALWASMGWVWREDIDRIAGASNGPHIVMMLRRKVTGDDGIEMEQVPYTVCRCKSPFHCTACRCSGCAACTASRCYQGCFCCALYTVSRKPSREAICRSASDRTDSTAVHPPHRLRCSDRAEQEHRWP